MNQLDALAEFVIDMMNDETARLKSMYRDDADYEFSNGVIAGLRAALVEIDIRRGIYS
jgi:hypothetical protein